MTQAPAGRLPGNLPLPDRLLAVATRMFAEKGFENTSVQEIVNAGVTKEPCTTTSAPRTISSTRSTTGSSACRCHAWSRS